MARAEAAGAVVAEVYESEFFEERLSQTLIDAVTIRESLRCRADHVWWLYIDSDEFPEGPDGRTVRQYLETLDKSFRIVGSTFFNHLPDTKPGYVPGYHPVDFQPLCYRRIPDWEPNCGHWKHPLQRFDRHGSFIQCEGGAHHAVGGTKGERAEPEGGVLTHHFQYRSEEVMRAKLALTCGSGSSRLDWMRTKGLHDFDMRLRSLDAVYSQQWDQVVDRLGVPLDRASFLRWDVGATRRWYPFDRMQEAGGSTTSR